MEKKKEFYNQLCEEERILTVRIDEDTETLKALKLLKKRYELDAKNREEEKGQQFLFDDPVIKVPRGYKKSMIIADKVLFALKAIGEGEIEDITNSLLGLEPAYGNEKARSNVKHWISKHHKSGLIEVLRRGSGKRSGLYKYIEK